RANIMWAATCGLNGMVSYGRTSADWGVHDIGHNLSLLYDIAHGATLSIVYPAWLKLYREKLGHRIERLGVLLFGTANKDDTIRRLERFFSSIGCPVSLSEAGIDNNKKPEILELLIRNKASGFVHKLCEQDYIRILEMI
ncbi:MAG: iron-containing alcohol dehydrogenase, partial [Bacteroidetes bacterium]|nr:iron-containing alcohol dehydrogenase [Bacteroidota bacterium]